MNEILKALYNSFYEKLPATRLKAEIERCHQDLIEKLDKPERKLVLQIIDCKDQIAENLCKNKFSELCCVLVTHILGDLDVKAFYQSLLKACHTLSANAKKVKEAIEKS